MHLQKPSFALSPIFVTGIGTGIGKTVIAAIVAEALKADYWKPVQAGLEGITDAEQVQQWIANKKSFIHPELYKLKMPASPHIAAREENIRIDINQLVEHFQRQILNSNNVVIEGAGGLLVPLNENEFVADLIGSLRAKVILVSRNYLGSINHSLLTAQVCRLKNLEVMGWIFNDNYLAYEEEIVKWSGFPSLGSIPAVQEITSDFISQQAEKLAPALQKIV